MTTPQPMFYVRLLRNGLYQGPYHPSAPQVQELREDRPDELTPLYAGAPQSGWISVDVRLPPKDVEVLVYTPASVQKVSLDEWGTYYECPVSFSTVTVPTGDGWLGHEFEEVTHWMEIPLPPSTKGEPT